MKRILSIAGIVICCILFLLIRGFEANLFYDPLLEFFEMDYKTMPLPKMDVWALYRDMAFRYFLNGIISLSILWLVFWDRGIIKLSAILYLALFILFFVIFTVLVSTNQGPDNLLVLFYVRRFLIQPIFLLILLPAFYFQKHKTS